MAKVLSTEAQRQRFLSEPRLGILITTRRDQSPMGVPVWFEWNGEAVRMFAAADSKKILRLQRNPNASLLVTNRVGESEAWIAFDGPVEISEKGGIELAEKLAPRYWNLQDPERANELDSWRAFPEAFRLLELRPDRIRTGS